MEDHGPGNLDCSACRRGFPIECSECGGRLIHASKGRVIETACDKCGEEDEETPKQ